MPDPILRRLQDPRISPEEKEELLRRLAERHSNQTGRPIKAAISEFRTRLFKPKLILGPSRILKILDSEDGN